MLENITQIMNGGKRLSIKTLIDARWVNSYCPCVPHVFSFLNFSSREFLIQLSPIVRTPQSQIHHKTYQELDPCLSVPPTGSFTKLQGWTVMMSSGLISLPPSYCSRMSAL